MPAGPVVTADYVGCCICDGYAHSNFFDFRKPYLPIPRTLYCTWGSWAGNLIWDNPSPVAWMPSGYQYNLWTGVATIPFKYRTDDAYGYCNPTIYDTTAECVVSFSCNGQAGWSVRATQKNQCCLELDESQSQIAGGGCFCYGLPFGHCFTCGESFAAALDGPTYNWINAPCIGGPYVLWGHNVCDLQTSNCYISE